MRGDKEKKDYLINYGFSSYDLVCLVVCSILGVWYLLKKVSHIVNLTVCPCVCPSILILVLYELLQGDDDSTGLYSHHMSICLLS